MTTDDWLGRNRHRRRRFRPVPARGQRAIELSDAVDGVDRRAPGQHFADHRCHGEHRLRRGSHAKDRILLHRSAALDVHQAVGLEVDRLAAPSHRRDRHQQTVSEQSATTSPTTTLFHFPTHHRRSRSADSPVISRRVGGANQAPRRADTTSRLSAIISSTSCTARIASCSAMWGFRSVILLTLCAAGSSDSNLTYNAVPRRSS